jgi:hypothetical protein
VSTYEWLLVSPPAGRVLLRLGQRRAGVLHWLAMRRERPSEIALLLGLVRPMVLVIGLGSLGAGVGLVRPSSKSATSRCAAA